MKRQLILTTEPITESALLAARNNLDRLLHFVTGKQQAAQSAANQRFDVATVVTAFAHPLFNPVGKSFAAREIICQTTCQIVEMKSSQSPKGEVA